MGFKRFYLSEAGNPSTTFSPDMEIKNPFTERPVNISANDYDASVEYSPMLSALFDGGITEKGQEGIPQGMAYPLWDRSSNHIFIVYGGPEEGGESEYDKRKEDFNRRGIYPPESRSDMEDLVKRGVNMPIFDKKEKKKTHFSRRAETPKEKSLARALKDAIIAHRDQVGTQYAIQNAEGIEDVII
jgi:hypothetical protein